MNEPLKRHVEEHYRSGEDLCASVWREYWSYQRALLPYRWRRLSGELSYIRGGRLSLAATETKDVVLYLRAITKCLFLFLLCTVVGRRSVFPPLEPGSPFAQEIEANWQPNHRRGVL